MLTFSLGSRVLFLFVYKLVNRQKTLHYPRSSNIPPCCFWRPSSLAGNLATWAPGTACSHPSDTAAASFQSDSLCELLHLQGHRSYWRSVTKIKWYRNTVSLEWFWRYSHVNFDRWNPVISIYLLSCDVLNTVSGWKASTRFKCTISTAFYEHCLFISHI